MVNETKLRIVGILLAIVGASFGDSVARYQIFFFQQRTLISIGM